MTLDAPGTNVSDRAGLNGRVPRCDQETDHSVVAALEARSTWRWCYVHRRTV
jgi:hypothetical protein